MLFGGTKTTICVFSEFFFFPLKDTYNDIPLSMQNTVILLVDGKLRGDTSHPLLLTLVDHFIEPRQLMLTSFAISHEQRVLMKTKKRQAM